MKSFAILISFVFVAACTQGQSRVSKKNFLKNHHSGKTFGKSTGYFKIDITSVDFENDQVQLVAKITPLKSMTDVDFKWTFPKNIALVSGEKQGSLDLSNKSESQVTLVFDKDSVEEGEQFFFFAYQMQNGERHGASKSFIFSQSNEEKSVRASSQKIKSKKHPKYFE